MTPNEKVRDLLTRKPILKDGNKLTQMRFGDLIGVAQSTVNRWKAGTAEPEGPSRDAINELYEQLSTAPTASTHPSKKTSLKSGVRLIGKAGAGPNGEVVFNSDEQDLGTVEPQTNSNEKTVALEVEGDSMRGIANDGWLVYYDDVNDAPAGDLFGELCVVRLADGRTMVKFIQPGRGDGLYDLESMNATTMRDVVVEWASPVTNIVPRKAARKMMKADPTLGLKTAKAG